LSRIRKTKKENQMQIENRKETRDDPVSTIVKWDWSNRSEVKEWCDVKEVVVHFK